MKRREVLKRVRDRAKSVGLEFTTYELTNHTGVKVGNTASTLGRHREIDDLTARKFWDQFEAEFGKGWWR